MKQMTRFHKILDLFGGRLKLNSSNKFELDDEQINTGTITVTASNVDSGEATSGQVLTADGSGGASWSDSVITSGEATSGQVLTADGEGGASWQTISSKIYEHRIGIERPSDAFGKVYIYMSFYSKSNTPYTSIETLITDKPKSVTGFYYVTNDSKVYTIIGLYKNTEYNRLTFYYIKDTNANMQTRSFATGEYSITFDNVVEMS